MRSSTLFALDLVNLNVRCHCECNGFLELMCLFTRKGFFLLMSKPQISAARLNYAQLKEQEQLNRERQRQEEFKNEKQQNLIQRQKAQYGHVTSHGYGSENTPAPSRQCKEAGDDVEIRVFVRECDPDAQAFRFLESSVAPLINRTGDVAGAKPVLHGRRASANADERQQAPQQPLGEVPKYLVKRKAQMEAEKEAIRSEIERQREQSQYPPGHRPVSEEERTAILDKLSQRRKELEQELGRLPMRFDTMALRQKRQQIEGEMAEVEAAHQKFSVKKQLFVPI